MKLHWPSFLIGAAVGAAGAVMWNRFRPLLVDLTTAGYEAGDALWSRFAAGAEDAEDLVAEAQARARPRGARVRTARRPPKRAARRPAKRAAR